MKCILVSSKSPRLCTLLLLLGLFIVSYLCLWNVVSDASWWCWTSCYWYAKGRGRKVSIFLLNPCLFVATVDKAFFICSLFNAYEDSDFSRTGSTAVETVCGWLELVTSLCIVVPSLHLLLIIEQLCFCAIGLIRLSWRKDL